MGAVRDWLSFGKVRVAYAGSANGTDPYKTQYVYGSGVFGGVPSRYLPSTLQSTDLQPQRSKS